MRTWSSAIDRTVQLSLLNSEESPFLLTQSFFSLAVSKSNSGASIPSSLASAVMDGGERSQSEYTRKKKKMTRKVSRQQEPWAPFYLKKLTKFHDDRALETMLIDFLLNLCFFFSKVNWPISQGLTQILPELVQLYFPLYWLQYTIHISALRCSHWPHGVDYKRMEEQQKWTATFQPILTTRLWSR